MVKTIIGKVVGEDGKDLEFMWNGEGTRLGVRVEGEDNYTFSSDLRGPNGPKGDDAYVIRFAQITDDETGEEKVEVQYYDSNDLTEPVYTEDFSIVGQQGDTGMYYYPSVNSNGDLTWTLYPPSTSQSLPAAVNIKGPAGPQGEPADGVALENFLWFEVNTDDTSADYGNLYVMGYDGADADFEYDDDSTSDTYGCLFKVYDNNNKVLLGNIKGPVGSVDSTILNRISTLETKVSTLESTVTNLSSTVGTLNSTVSSLSTTITELENTVETLNNTLELIEEQEQAQNTLLGND